MSEFSRRSFLKAAAGIPLAFFATPGKAQVPPWGEFRNPAIVWPNGVPNNRVLEIFLYGGLSPWETFYHRPNLSDPWLGFATELGNLAWTCSGAPATNFETRLLGVAAPGSSLEHEVHCGPATKPLWRSDIFDRMRVVVLTHGLFPHEAAIPLALTGHLLGRPRFASMGAAVSHYARTHDAMVRTTPYAYAIVPQTFRFPSDNLQATSAVGMHPATERPLTIQIGSGSNDLVARLARTERDARTDALINQYRAQYQDQLRWINTGDPVRSKAFAAFDLSVKTLLKAASLKALLDGSPLALRSDVPCPAFTTGNPALSNIPGTGIRLAAYLLTRPDPARYVCVVDSGHAEHPMGGGYDTHGSSHTRHTSVNLWNTLSSLAAVIKDPANPGPDDAQKIDLGNTLVLITSEFGRTPYKSSVGDPDPNSDGRDHWPAGYVSVLIGGPITQRGVAGAIEELTPTNHQAAANRGYTPTDLRAAALVAAGIDPFKAENYGIGDVSAIVRAPMIAQQEDQTSANLRRDILGVPDP